jgi:23S rRNA (cytidine1920-2'-O)/16S rRNA (cytidine1409-2'-O)-methyltransferase
MVRRGLVATRSEANVAISARKVTVAGRPASKPGTLVGPDEAVHLSGPVRRFVSRGGEKLDAALDRFGLAVTGRRALDAGASTGGFTDCLLSREAASVVAVDVGYGQLDWRLRQDPRVAVLERTNVRTLTRESLPYRPDLVVADLSFISLDRALPALLGVSTGDAEFILLVKPQFEAGIGAVSRGGVVRDPQVWRSVLLGIAGLCGELGLEVGGVMASPLKGPAGNVEFLLYARHGPALESGSSAPEAQVEAAIHEAMALVREAP